MSAVFITVWVLVGSITSSGAAPIIITNIASETSCHALAVSLRLTKVEYRCRSYDSVVGTTDYPKSAK